MKEFLKITTLSDSEMEYWDAIREGVREQLQVKLIATAQEHWHVIESEHYLYSVWRIQVRAFISGFFAGLKAGHEDKKV